MKVYSRVVIKIETGEILDETSFDYSGPVAQAGGGGSTKSTTNVKLDPASIQMNQMRLQQEQALNPFKRAALNQFGTLINPGYSIGGFTGGGGTIPGTGLPSNVDPSSPLGGLLKIYPGLSSSLSFTPEEGAFLEKWLGMSLPSTTTGKKKNAITSYDFPVPILFDQQLADVFFKGAGINPETGDLLNPPPATPTTGRRSRKTQAPALTFGQQVFPVYQKLTGLLGNPVDGTTGGTTPGGTEGGTTGGGTQTIQPIDPIFSQFPGLAGLKFATPEQAFMVSEAARLTDTSSLENAARTTLENIVAPKLLSQLTAAGMGRSGAIGQALGDAGAQFALPISQFSTQARQNLGNLVGQLGANRTDFIKSLGLPSTPFFSSGSTTGTSSTPSNPFNTVAQIGTGLAGAASLISAAPTIMSGLSSAGSAIAAGVGSLASMF